MCSAPAHPSARSPIAPTCCPSPPSRSPPISQWRGRSRLRLWVACDTPDADIHAKLVDVRPPNEDYKQGFATNLCEGLLRLRYRNSSEQPSLMTVGDVYPIRIALFPTANLFQRGHLLRLDLAGSNFPHFDINPNSGEPEGAGRHPRPARTRIFVEPVAPLAPGAAGHPARALRPFKGRSRAAPSR